MFKQYAWESTGIIITSFGFAIIVPSPRRYGGDRETALLPKVVLWGSFLPLMAYLIWALTVRAVIPD